MISIGFITSRYHPRFEWFFDSLSPQVKDGDDIEIIIVDSQFHQRSDTKEVEGKITHIPPKPTVFSGPHRLTRSEWWSKSNALNTFLCRARGTFLACVDDRCVLAPDWMDSVRKAMAGDYAACGAYEKRINMRVENGEIVDPGTVIGTDHRCEGHLPRARHCIPGWFFGCSIALPTEWALQVNGWSEKFCGLGAEDTHFGHLLKNNGFDIRFNPVMKVIQDRTPGECGPEMKRSSKERFPHDTEDKGHKAIEFFFGEKQSSHVWNIREIRDSVLAGGEWPSVDKFPAFDWYDGKLLSEFE